MDKHHVVISIIILVCALIGLTACGDMAQLPLSASFGANPTLPAPRHTLFPSINIAKPVSSPDTVVATYAKDLVHPDGSMCYPTVMYWLQTPTILPSQKMLEGSEDGSLRWS